MQIAGLSCIVIFPAQPDRNSVGAEVLAGNRDRRAEGKKTRAELYSFSSSYIINK